MKDVGEKRNVINEIDLNFLNQLTISLEQAEIKFEQAFKRKKVEQFNSVKQFILKINKKISEGI